MWLQLSPPSDFVSFKFSDWAGWAKNDIKRVLINQTELKTIYIFNDKRLWSEPERGIRSEDRLPPIEELVLENYQWCHTALTAVSFWNWTKIRRLELRDISLLLFTATVPPEHLEHLKHLVILTSPYSESTALLNGEMSYYLKKIPALETLKISCEPSSILQDALKHGPTLRSLELLNYNVLQSRYYTIFSTGQVETINANCPNLMEFGVEVYSKNDAASMDAIRINSHIFSNMRNLRTLTLYAYDVDPEWGPLDDLSEEDLADQLESSVRGWLDALILAKHGARFEWICLSMMVAHGTYKKVRMRVKWKYEDGTGLGRPVFLVVSDD